MYICHISIFYNFKNLKKSGKSQSLESNQTKINRQICRPGFIESVHEGLWKNATSLMPPSTDISGIQF